MVRFVGEQAFETVVERTLARQLVTRLVDALPGGGGSNGDGEDEGDLEDPDFQLELFRWREEHVLGGVARRLKRGLDSGADQFDVFNECQDHVLTAARAHIDRLILESFTRAVDSCEDEEMAKLLDSLRRLHALALIEADRGWYFEHGRMTAPRAKAITRAINRLCGELREHAELLVDAFGIPDTALAAPIALQD
jgi:acyl-CoA oxidase